MKTKLFTFFLALVASIGTMSATITVRLDPQSCSSWSVVRLWAWTSKGNLFDAWPGIVVSKDDNGWYSYIFDKTIDKVSIIWTDGTNQTIDITNVSESTCYALNSTIGNNISVTTVTCPSDNKPDFKGTCGDNLTWELSNGVLTISGTGAMYNYSNGTSPWNKQTITTLIINNGATSIGDYAFYHCTGLTSIEIPSSVTSIGSLAFSGCSSLTSVSIPNSITSIENGAFKDCTALTSIEIPSGVTSIEYFAFHGCSSLTSVTIPNSVTSIGTMAFYGCTALTSVTIPNSVKTIDMQAFEKCNNLMSVNINDILAWCAISFANAYSNPLYYAHNLYLNETLVTNLVIPNAVTRIQQYTFCGCTSLTSVTIPNSVTSIRTYAFYGCNSLTSVTIPNSVTSISTYAFYRCNSLTSVTIPNSVTGIGESAFCECPNIDTVTLNSNAIAGKQYVLGTSSLAKFFDKQAKAYVIGGSVTSIGQAAFYNCSGLKSITIPNSVTSIGQWAFMDCSSLTSIEIPESVTSIEKQVFQRCTDLTSVTIPNSVTSIGGSAFSGCSSLTSVSIPNSVTSIGSDAFRGCSSLTAIEIPESITSIVSNVFLNCSSLTSVTIPNSVTSIGKWAFCNCSSLTSMTIPNSVTFIGNEAFKNCTGLASVTCEAVNPPTLGSDVFYSVDKSIPLYVPKKSVDKYKAADQWKDFYIVAIDQETPETFTITFVNWDGEELLKLTDVEEGILPVYTGATPTRPADTHYTYTFSGWSPEIVAATANATYIATYEAEPIGDGIEIVQKTNVQCTKLLRDGKLFILRGNKTYTTMGQEVR